MDVKRSYTRIYGSYIQQNFSCEVIETTIIEMIGLKIFLLQALVLYEHKKCVVYSFLWKRIKFKYFVIHDKISLSYENIVFHHSVRLSIHSTSTFKELM